MKQGIFFDAGEGMKVSARGSYMIFKAIAGSTDGTFSLMERELPVSNRRPQPHTHEGPEGFYVLEGLIEFVVGDQRRIGGPGFWALVPSGIPHTFGNVGDYPARLLIIHVPAADAYFVELQELWGKETPPTPEEERELMKRHGLRPATSDT